MGCESIVYHKLSCIASHLYFNEYCLHCNCNAAKHFHNCLLQLQFPFSLLFFFFIKLMIHQTNSQFKRKYSSTMIPFFFFLCTLCSIKNSNSQYVRRSQIEKNLSSVHMKKGSTTETEILMQSTSNRIHGNRGEKMKSVQIVQRCEWRIFCSVLKRDGEKLERVPTF